MKLYFNVDTWEQFIHRMRTRQLWSTNYITSPLHTFSTIYFVMPETPVFVCNNNILSVKFCIK